MNKFVTFSIHENDLSCYEKTVASVKLIGRDYYKGWKSCVCIGNAAPKKYVAELVDTADRVVFINSNGASLMLEKLLPLFDEHIECFVSRSCNSIVSHKESELIESWVESEKQLCLLRENGGQSMDLERDIFGVKQSVSRLIRSQLQNIYNSRKINLKINLEEFYNQYNELFFSEVLV